MNKKNTEIKKNHRKIGKRGYRLHDERIFYSGGEGSMRTIKYPLIGENNNIVFDCIKHDYVALYGDLNFNDFIETKISNKKRYSFIEFWVEAITSGFIFSKSSHAIEDFSKFFKKKSLGEQIYDNMPTDLKNQTNREDFLEFWKKSKDGRSRKNDNNLDRAFGENEDIKNKIKNAENGELETYLKIFDIEEEKIIKPDKEYTYPFIFNVNFETDKISNENITTKLDSLISYYKNLGFDAKPKSELSNYFGLYQQNQAIFLAVFKLVNFLQETNDFSEYSKLLKDNFSFNENELAKTINAFKTLKTYADKLPKEPLLVKEWTKYIQELGGTLESWYSNKENKNKETINNCVNVRKSAIEIKEKLKEYENIDLEDNDFSNLKDKLNDSLDRLINTLNKVDNLPSEIIKSEDNIPDNISTITMTLTNEIEQSQAILRTDLNYFSQNTKKQQNENNDIKTFYDVLGGKTKNNDKGSEKKSNEPELVKNIKVKVQSSPFFFGEQQKIYYEKAYNAKKHVRDNLKILLDTYSNLIVDIDDNILIEAKDVQKLADTANRVESEKIKKVFEKIEKLLEVNFNDSQEYVSNEKGKNKKNSHRYFINKFSKNKFYKADLSFNEDCSIASIIKVAQLDSLYSIEKYDDTDLRDTIALSKNLLSLLIYHTKSDNKQNITDLEFKVGFAHSELAGLVSIISKKEFISRYSLQATNGMQAKIYFDKSKNKYGYAFPGIKGDGFTEKTYYKLSENYKDLNPKKFLENDKKMVDKAKVANLEIRSSKYQIQFLEWFFLKHKKKKNKLQINGPFSIADEDLNIDWEKDYPIILKTNNSIKKSKKYDKVEQSKIRVYTSQPFTIIPDTSIKRKENDNKLKNRFIGVDIGEYGLAYCIIEVNEIKETDNKKIVEIIEKGFIASPEQEKLKDDVKKFRNSVVKSTFTSTNTHIANLRESLIQYYNNRLSDLQVRHNARPSFEKQVSAFESGGKKISKIYDSVKRGFFYGRNAAERADAKQVFGKINQKDGKAKSDNQLVPWAVQITAEGTSQTCSKCHTWYKHAPADTTNVRYYENGKIQNKLLKDMTEDEKGGIYKAMRPPYKTKDKNGNEIINIGMKIVNDKIKKGELKIDIDNFIKKRGNSAIYVCPICGHISDADLQAALNIAIRGYLKATEQSKNIKKSNKIDFNVPFFNEKIKGIEYPAISLEDFKDSL